MKLNKIYEGMPKAAESINDNFNMLNDEDTGWLNIPTKNGAAGKVSARKIGNRVSIEIENLTIAAGNGGANSFALLPVGFRPKRNSVVRAGSLGHVAGSGTIAFYESGEILLYSISNIPGGTYALRATYDFYID